MLYTSFLLYRFGSKFHFHVYLVFEFGVLLVLKWDPMRCLEASWACFGGTSVIIYIGLWKTCLRYLSIGVTPNFSIFSKIRSFLFILYIYVYIYRILTSFEKTDSHLQRDMCHPKPVWYTMLLFFATCECEGSKKEVALFLCFLTRGWSTYAWRPFRGWTVRIVFC